MTAKVLSTMLSGREYCSEITKEEELLAADAGLVVVFGYSDDNVELRGAINEEVGAWNGTTLYVTPEGLLEEPSCSDADNCNCKYFTAAKRASKTIDAIWSRNGVPWTFETDIPHEKFGIFEDGEPFCEGIVFSMKDL